VIKKDGFAGQSEPQQSSLRETVTVSEDLRLSRQVTFTAKPKTFRIRRGKTIVIRRCQEVMHHLWMMGLKNRVRHEPIESAIFYCVGGDYRTIKKYLGFRITLRKGNAIEPPQTRWVQGYLERLHYIDRAGNGEYVLRHECVPLNYHYEEKFDFLAHSECPNEESSSSKEEMCVCGEAEESGCCEHGLEAIASGKKETNKQNTHTKQLSESNLPPEELRVLEASLLRRVNEPSRGGG